jgi:hypothetical protein
VNVCECAKRNESVPDVSVLNSKFFTLMSVSKERLELLRDTFETGGRGRESIDLRAWAG